MWYTPHNPPPRFLCLELMRLSSSHLTAPPTPLSLVSSPFIGGCLLSQAFAPPQLGASATTHLSILACIGKVFACCLHQEHKRLPVVQPLHSLCSKLHLGTLLLFAHVVSLQYLVGSYGYSCTISVCPRAIYVLQISPYSLLMFDSSSSCHNTYPVKIGCQSSSPCCISLPLSGSSSILPSRNQSPNLASLEKSPLHQILNHAEPNYSPCVVILLVFTSFITNCYIYENSIVWIILQLSKFPGKIRGVTLVPLKTQSPRQNFLGHIYPSYCLSIYITIC